MDDLAGPVFLPNIRKFGVLQWRWDNPETIYQKRRIVSYIGAYCSSANDDLTAIEIFSHATELHSL